MNTEKRAKLEEGQYLDRFQLRSDHGSRECTTALGGDHGCCCCLNDVSNVERREINEQAIARELPHQVQFNAQRE